MTTVNKRPDFDTLLLHDKKVYYDKALYLIDAGYSTEDYIILARKIYENQEYKKGG